MRIRRTIRAALVGVAALGVIAASAGCTPVPDTYVAIGDSYVAGPLIPNQSLSPLGCLRSSANYPSLARGQIKVTRFVDVSCSGATTDDMFAPQSVTPGPANPAQVNAVDARTKVVTLGIGGNDIGFSRIVQDCATQNPFGRGCTPNYVHDGRDEISEDIAATAPDVARTVAAIKARGPQANVFIVGYPTILPNTGTGCYPSVPILPSDVPYLRAKTLELNAMLRAVAQQTNVHYVDVYTPSIGHDVCSGSARRWVEGIIPGTAAAPVHPNAAGMRATAGFVATAINRVVTT